MDTIKNSSTNVDERGYTGVIKLAYIDVNKNCLMDAARHAYMDLCENYVWTCHFAEMLYTYDFSDQMFSLKFFYFNVASSMMLPFAYMPLHNFKTDRNPLHICLCRQMYIHAYD
mgnify:FL=1